MEKSRFRTMKAMMAAEASERKNYEETRVIAEVDALIEETMAAIDLLAQLD